MHSCVLRTDPRTHARACHPLGALQSISMAMEFGFVGRHIHVVTVQRHGEPSRNVRQLPIRALARVHRARVREARVVLACTYTGGAEVAQAQQHFTRRPRDGGNRVRLWWLPLIDLMCPRCSSAFTATETVQRWFVSSAEHLCQPHHGDPLRVRSPVSAPKLPSIIQTTSPSSVVLAIFCALLAWYRNWPPGSLVILRPCGVPGHRPAVSLLAKTPPVPSGFQRIRQ